MIDEMRARDPIKLKRRSNFRFIVPQGKHDAPVNVKISLLRPTIHLDWLNRTAETKFYEFWNIVMLLAP